MVRVIAFRWNKHSRRSLIGLRNLDRIITSSITEQQNEEWVSPWISPLSKCPGVLYASSAGTIHSNLTLFQQISVARIDRTAMLAIFDLSIPDSVCVPSALRQIQISYIAFPIADYIFPLACRRQAAFPGATLRSSSSSSLEGGMGGGVFQNPSK